MTIDILLMCVTFGMTPKCGLTFTIIFVTSVVAVCDVIAEVRKWNTFGTVQTFEFIGIASPFKN